MRLRPYGDSGPARLQPRVPRDLLHLPGARVGALRLDQGARADRAARAASSTAWCGRSCSASTSTTPRSARCARLHAEVRREVERRELAGNVKLGPGGIREIEFVAQALQLIRGGRDAELTARPTLQVLSVLSRKESSSRRLPRRSSPRPTSSCATSSTGCSTSTTRSATTCPRRARTATLLAGMCGFPSWDAFFERAGEPSRRGDAPLPGGVRRARSSSSRPGRSTRASPRCARASATPRCRRTRAAASTR